MNGKYRSAVIRPKTGGGWQLLAAAAIAQRLGTVIRIWESAEMQPLL